MLLPFIYCGALIFRAFFAPDRISIFIFKMFLFQFQFGFICGLLTILWVYFYFPFFRQYIFSVLLVNDFSLVFMCHVGIE